MRTSILRAFATRLADPDITPMLRAASMTDPDTGIAGASGFQTGASARRDIPDYQRMGAVERGMTMLDKHPLVARGAQILSDWMGASEFRPVSPHPAVQGVLDEFFGDPRNRWPVLLPQIADVLFATGELFLPARVCPKSGLVTVDYFDPADVVGVRFVSGSNTELASVVHRAQGAQAATEYTIIRARSTAMSGGVRLMGRAPMAVSDGDEQNGVAGVLAHRFNCRPNSGRGRGDFASAIDYLAMLDDFEAAVAERNTMLARYMGDIGIDGDAAAVAEAQQTFASMPGYASVFVHNKSVTAKLEVPSTNGGDVKESERILRTYATAIMGIPPHILSGDFSEGNRAVAAGTDDPAFLSARAKQARLAGILHHACSFAVDSVWLVNPNRLHGVDWRDADSWRISIKTPNLLSRDPEKAAPVIAQLIAAAATAQDAKLLDRATARRLAIAAAAELGIDVTAEALDAGLLSDAAAVASATDPQSRATFAEMERRMRESTPPARVAAVRLAADCGTGAGGFKKGNTCGDVGDGEKERHAPTVAMIVRDADKELKKVTTGARVDGREVLSDVPNKSSIESSLTDWDELPGIREVPMSAFPGLTGTSYSVSEDKRIERLADAIKTSKQISPLIVVIDKDGPYILEGGHRADALKKLNANAFPALVVIDRGGAAAIPRNKIDE